MNIKNKRLLILGGNPETGALVNYANEMGVYTIVIDPNPSAPAKKFAKEYYDIDVMNIDLLIEKVKILQLDGILVGVADILVPSYNKICTALKFPCYAPIDSIEVFTTKSGFREQCEKYNINVIPYFKLDKNLNKLDLEKISYPVLIKPVDNGAGVGMNVSNNEKELKQHVDIALLNSKRKEFLTEKFMNCDDMLVYYTISDGIPYLSAAADRFTIKSQKIGSPVCMAASYPSKYLNEYISTTNDNVVKLIKDAGVKNGVLNIQFFVEKNIFYAYDPGFRIQGEAPHLYLNKINGFDNRKMLINFALTSNTGEPELYLKNDPNFKGKKACTLWILLKEGEIANISGLDKIKKNLSIFEVIQRLNIGDKVTHEMLGTERQVFARFYILEDNTMGLQKVVSEIQSNLLINNKENSNMILELFNENKL
jgi:biotin carboxylase